MRIVNVETYFLKVPYAEPEMKGMDCDLLFVRVDTDRGISGWGQAWSMRLADATQVAIENTVAPYCLGQSAKNFDQVMWNILKSCGNTRYGPLTFAVSAIDIALWDIQGKVAGCPVHQLFSDSDGTHLETYASLIFYRDAELAAQRAREAVGLGYRHIKLHEETVDAVRATREAVGPDVSIRLDPAASYPWNAEEAKAIAPAFEEFDLTWLEEPIWPVEDYWSLGQLSEITTTPLAAGENCVSALDFRNLRETGRTTYLQPSVTKIGGISETLKVIEYAENSGAIYTPHSFYYGPGYLATLHLVASCSHSPLVEHPYYRIEGYPYGADALTENGQVKVPTQPGLGFDPRPEFLHKYRVR